MLYITAYTVKYTRLMPKKGDSRAKQLRDRYYCQFEGQRALQLNTKVDVQEIVGK